MMEYENNKKWNSFFDEISLEGENKSIISLRRKYLKNNPDNSLDWVECYTSKPNLDNIVAKGISAFLSFDNMDPNFGHSLRFLMRKKKPFDFDKIFQQYFNFCFKFFVNAEKEISLKSKRKSTKELIMLHLQDEERLFNESQLLFNQLLEGEKQVIEKIKEAALDYRKWVREENHIDDKQDKDYSKLLDALSKYVNDIKSIEFTYIINHHTLSEGTLKAKWIGKKMSYARYFADITGMTVKEFNDCFSLPNGKKLEYNNRPTTNFPFKGIFKTHFKK